MEKRKLDRYVRKAVRKNLPEELIMQKMTKAGFSEIDVHQAIKRVEAESKNTKKVSKLVYFIPLVIPLVLVGYVIYMNLLPYEETYVIDVGSEGDLNNLNRAYLKDDNRTSASIITGHTTYRSIKKSPVYFIVKPDVILDNKSVINVELTFQSDSDLYISLSDGKNFSWVPIYFVGLDRYTLASEFYDANVYSLNKREFVNSSSVVDFLVNNVPEKENLSIVNYTVNETLLKKYGYKISNKLTNQSSFVIISGYKHPQIEGGWYKASISLPYHTDLGEDVRIALKPTKKGYNVNIDVLKVQVVQ